MDSKLEFLTKELIDEAVLEIDENGIPPHRKGTDYAVSINGKKYPFKLLITEAAKLAGKVLTVDAFSSNAYYRGVFENITGYNIIKLKHKMTFENLKELVDIINNSLGGFCSEFQYKRKELLKMGSASSTKKLFIHSADGRNWVINPGGGTELQYHLYISDDELGYGLGFNTQYVPFANKKTPIDYIKPFVKSFLSKSEYQNDLFESGFEYIQGDESELRQLKDNNYVLIGKKIIVTKSKDEFKIDKDEFNNIINDLKGVLYSTYVKILKNMNNSDYTGYNSIIDVLEYKKQVILQGPPGTGKTYTAKNIAEQMLTGGITYDKKKQAENLQKSGQFELVQFHPSYTYEDFVRGIVVESQDDKVVYKTKDKTIGLFAKKALENFNLSRAENTEAVINKWINDKFEEFKNEIEVSLEQDEINLSGDITIYDIGNNSFKYGKNWKANSNLNFSEFKKLIKAVLENKLTVSNQQMSKDISVHAHYRYTYYNALLALFFEKFEYTTHEEVVPEKKYILVIDEINRANLPSVLGELIYALEYRNHNVKSMYALDGEDQDLQLPKNLYIIGTMNTADRSVGHIDYAIRRRFSFINVLPNEEIVTDEIAKKLFKEVEKLFIEIKDGIPRNAPFLAPDFDYKDVQIGHSYFLLKENSGLSVEEELKFRLDYEIKPILYEYVKDGVLLESAIKEINSLSIG